MPFSPAFKAGLVAVVLVILTHVSRIDAAPVDLQLALAGPLGRVRNLIDDRVGSSTPMDLDPAPDGGQSFTHSVTGPFRPYDTTQYANRQPLPPAGNDYAAGGPGHHVRTTRFDLNEPYNPPRTVSLTRPPNAGVDGGSSNWNRHGWDRAPSGSSAAAAHAGQKMVFAPMPSPMHRVGWWSEKDPEAWIGSTQWSSLDARARAAALNAFGPKVFSMEVFRRLAPLSQELLEAERDGKRLKFRMADKLQRDLVDEYLRIRFEERFGQRRTFQWYPDVLPTVKNIFENTRDAARNHGPPLLSAMDEFKHGPVQPFVLGDFEIHFYHQSSATRTSLFSDPRKKYSRKRTDPVDLYVIGYTSSRPGEVPTKERLYLGKVTVSPGDQFKEVKRQRRKKSRRVSA